MYENKDMLSWLGYFADMMKVSPEKIKMLNICGKQKNVVPTMICTQNPGHIFMN